MYCKMKAILLLVLSVIILSQGYGLAYADHGGSSHATFTAAQEASSVPIITLETDSASYETGETIHVHGTVSDYNAEDPYKNFDVTLRVIAPNNNIISISQIPLENDGSYSTTIPAGGPLWKSDGDYTIHASHGSDRNTSVIFGFADAEQEVVEETVEESEVIEVSEEELAKGCGEGTHLEDGVCVLDESTGSTESTSVSTGSVPATGMNAWIYSITFTVLIAFAIMIILYVISRASRRKIVN